MATVLVAISEKENEEQKIKETKELMAGEGIILTDVEAKEVCGAKLDKAAAEAKVKECYIQRKLKQFFKHPVIPDLKQNMEIIDGVLKAMEQKDHEINRILLSENKKHSHWEIVNYIKWIQGGSKTTSFFTKGKIIFFVVAIIVAVGAFFLYKYFSKPAIELPSA